MFVQCQGNTLRGLADSILPSTPADISDLLPSMVTSLVYSDNKIWKVRSQHSKSSYLEPAVCQVGRAEEYGLGRRISMKNQLKVGVLSFGSGPGRKYFPH